ncbi:MAG TPA: single-stranded DNA-binding protein [Lentisphaeria bacterium]|mgnify:CR=1 FL=1|nr:single-stranded DNA-binding protein [Lentisphaeria bacterium]
MAPNLNKVFLMGNLTRDPEMRTLPSGTAVCTFGVAVNRQFVNAAGVTQEEVCFIDVSAFGRTGEVVAQYLRKGSPIFVEGRLYYEQWDDRETGKKRSRLSVTAERVQLIGGVPTGRDGGYAEDEQANAAYPPGGGWQQRPLGGPPPPQGGWQQRQPYQRGPAAPGGGWQQRPQGGPPPPQGGWQQPPQGGQAQSAPQGNWPPPPPPPAPDSQPQAPAAPPMPQFEPLPEEDSGGDDLPF